jgi:hypothetical protein
MMPAGSGEHSGTCQFDDPAFDSAIIHLRISFERCVRIHPVKSRHGSFQYQCFGKVICRRAVVREDRSGTQKKSCYGESEYERTFNSALRERDLGYKDEILSGEY